MSFTDIVHRINMGDDRKGKTSECYDMGESGEGEREEEALPTFTQQLVGFTSETTLHGVSRITANGTGYFRR